MELSAIVGLSGLLGSLFPAIKLFKSYLERTPTLRFEIEINGKNVSISTEHITQDNISDILNAIDEINKIEKITIAAEK